MTQLIVQADDAAISRAVTLGILDAARHGAVRTTGVFTNCPDAPLAAADLRDVQGLEVGIDLNLVTGRPVLDPRAVPDLVTPTGRFRTSHEIRASHEIVRRDGFYLEFAQDPFHHDQALAEGFAQVERFVELFGRPPAYLHHHALVSTVSDQVIHEVAAAYDLLVMDDLMRSGALPSVPNDWYVMPFGPAEQAAADPVAAVEASLPGMVEHDLVVLITHPGYVDAALLDASSYSVIRARDLELVTSPRFLDLLASLHIEITTFTEAGLAPGAPALP